MTTRRVKRKKYNYNTNRRKLWKKSKRVPDIKCTQIKQAWDRRKSVKQNLSDMGIATDPNQAIPIPKVRDLVQMESMDLEVARKQSKKHVVEDMEEEANLPQKKTLRLSKPEVSFCTYMLDKYGDNYKAMARDEKNYYQDTPKQIKRRINTFKSVPEHYKKYLEEKAGKGSEKKTETMDTS
ncbi:nucleolar protein 16-like [Glandiceps talaboti]